MVEEVPVLLSLICRDDAEVKKIMAMVMVMMMSDSAHVMEMVTDSGQLMTAMAMMVLASAHSSVWKRERN